MAWINTDSLSKEQSEPKKKTLTVDFDGTLVENDYPTIGRPCPGAIEVLRELMALGWGIILETIRTDNELQQAVVYCNRNYIDLYGINKNPDQAEWSSSTKVHATLKIDDRHVGIPLMMGGNEKPCVDWAKVRDLFVQWEVLPPLNAVEDGTKTFEIK